MESALVEKGLEQLRRRASVGTYLGASVVVVLVLFGAIGLYFGLNTMHSARARAQSDAHFKAGLAAAAIGDSINTATQEAAAVASQTGIAAVFASPAACSLQFSPIGVFTTGHIDLVAASGQDACSSLSSTGAPAGASYAGAPWLRQALAGNVVSAPFFDRLSSGTAIAVAVPILDGSKPVGTATAVLDLNGVTDGLRHTYGGPEQWSFNISTKTGLLAGSPSGRHGAIESAAPVPAVGWRVAASASASATLGPTRSILVRAVDLGVAALVVLLALLVFVHRRLVRPLAGLTAAAAQAARQVDPEPLPVVGPAEVAELAARFNEMIGARAAYEEQLAHQAFHDPLTGLPNRALFVDRLRQSLRRASKTPGHVAVLLLDLDRFKLVNDSFSHRVGDELLVAIVPRLAAALGPGDTLARLGGDEFVVLCEGLPSEGAAQTVARRLGAALESPFRVAGSTLTLTASIGVVVAGPGSWPEDLLRDADTAMYRAKEDGGARFHTFAHELRSTITARLALENDLRDALGRGELHLAYQPTIDLSSGHAVGAEALLRWEHPTRGTVSPGQFIPIAEETGLILAMGTFVFEQACRQSVAWAERGHDLRVSVNVSGRQLADPDFAEQITTILATTGAEARHLCLELTESVLMIDAPRAVETLGALKKVGLQISIDDFGTGYSSLAYLKRFPVDELKIDRMFVAEITHDESTRNLVSAITAMGRALGLHVVAEGVERRDEAVQLHALGCDTAQGYLFARPVAPATMTAMLDEDWWPGAA